MMSAAAIISVLTATISSKFIEQRIRKGQGLEKVKLKNHIVICGWNFNVDDIILALEKELEFPSIVLVNSCDPSPIGEIISRHKESEISFVSGDFSKDAILDKANVRMAECVIIVADANELTSSKADEKTIITTLTIKNMNQKIRVYAHITNPENESHLKRAKADDVVVSDKYSGFLLAMHITNPGVPRVVDELLSFRFGQVILRMPLPNSLIGKTFWEACDYLKQSNNAILIGLAKETQAMALNEMLTDDNSYIDQFIRQRLMQSEKKFGEEERLAITVNPEKTRVIEAGEVGIIITDKY
jgi:voltage-gated potassium channel